jgi:hypothetical protein
MSLCANSYISADTRVCGGTLTAISISISRTIGPIPANRSDTLATVRHAGGLPKQPGELTCENCPVDYSARMRFTRRRVSVYDEVASLE